MGVPRSSLPVGLALTYEAAGAWDRLGEVTVVVASNGSQGQLFAGRSRSDLAEEMAFPCRPWMGDLDADLNPLGSDGTPYWKLFDWPLKDGKSWTFDDDPAVEVTAERASIPGPGGPREGIRIQGGSENLDLTYTYDPDVGYLTTFQEDWRGTRVLDLRLVEVARSEEWIWGEVGEEASTCGDPTGTSPPPPASTLDVPSEADAVFATAGSIGDGTTSVTPPPTNGSEPWTHEHVPEEQWVYEAFDALEGAWSLEAVGRPDALEQGTYTCTSVVWVTLTGPGAG